MTTKNYFARNADGSVKTKQPCQTPGCDYPNFHVCLVGKLDTTGIILSAEQEIEQERRRRRGNRGHSDEMMAEIARVRWATIRAENRPRDLAWQREFLESGMSRKDFAAKKRISTHTLRNALKRTEREFE